MATQSRYIKFACESVKAKYPYHKYSGDNWHFMLQQRTNDLHDKASFEQTSNSLLYTWTNVWREQSFDFASHFIKQKDVQENSASQEGDPTRPPRYLSPMDYCISLLYCVNERFIVARVITSHNKQLVHKTFIIPFKQRLGTKHTS